MRGKDIKLAVCVVIAAALLSTVLYIFHTRGYMNVALFYVGWALAVYGLVQFYRDRDEHDAHGHDHDHHDGHGGHDGHPNPHH